MVLSDLAGELRGGSDPLGYDTSKPFLEVAREMADDVPSGRKQAAIEEEAARVRRHLWPGLKRRWIVLAADGRHGTLGRYTDPAEPEVARVEASLKELAAGGWLAALHGTYYDPASGVELRMVRQRGDPDVQWETAAERFLEIWATALRERQT